jgi:hypothetical protein
MAELNLTGIDGLQQQLARLPTLVMIAALHALREEAVRILAASQLLVPVSPGEVPIGPRATGGGHATPAHAPGFLRSTGEVAEEEPGIITIRYGGHGAAPYALIQHEHLGYRHTTGQAKYLQQPFFEATSGMAERLAASIRTHLGA